MCELFFGMIICQRNGKNGGRRKGEGRQKSKFNRFPNHKTLHTPILSESPLFLEGTYINCV